MFLFILGKDYGSETTGRESLEGGGLNIDYKRGRKKKTENKNPKKKAAIYIIFFFEKPEPSG